MDPTRRFSDRVDDYARFRPSYPAELIPLLEERAGLTPSSVVANVFAYVQLLDRGALRGRLLSSSYTPGKGHPDHAPMLEALDRIFDEYQEDGIVRLEYTTQIFIGCRKDE